MKKILVVLDGAADLPVSSFGGRTPLEFANTPNLDWFVKQGKMGYMYPIDEKTIPGSDNSLISIFGNDPQSSPRGILEAVGLGIKMNRGDLALRTNFGTIDNIKNKLVIDRRAGRTLTTKEAKILANALNKKIKLKCDFQFKSSVQHRGVLVLRGNHSTEISNVDPEWINSGKNEIKFEFCKSLDRTPKSLETSKILNEFLVEAFKILNNHPINLRRLKRGLLPANMLFFRGPGNKLPNLKKYPHWASINFMPLEIGIAELSGMKNFSFSYPSMRDIDVYKNLYRGLNKSLRFGRKKIRRGYKKYDGFYLQFKETDIPGHDNKPIEKKKMLEIIDKKFFSFLRKFAKNNEFKLVVTCDHSTPCKLKAHSADPVPVLVYGDGEDGTVHFSEMQSKKGELGKIYGKDFMKKTRLRN